jgi:uncharacterized protein (TIGR00106 family)
MLAQFSIWPLDEPHMAKDMSQLTEVLQRHGVEYEMGPMGTTVQGEWNDVMGAIEACHRHLRDSHRRVFTSITIDDDATRPQDLQQTKNKVAASS